MPHNDPIIEEIHRCRREYSARFDGDLQAMLADIRAGEEELKKQGWKVISLPARRIPPKPTPINPTLSSPAPNHPAAN